MIEHDGDVGKLLKAIDDLGIANNTIVIYGTDNGVHMIASLEARQDSVILSRPQACWRARRIHFFLESAKSRT